jgi:hypothetical protein
MKEGKYRLLIIIIGILLFSLIIQAGLCSTAILFLNIEKESKFYELDDVKIEKKSQCIQLPVELNFASLENSSCLSVRFIITTSTDGTLHSQLPVNCNLSNHSPPSSYYPI